MKKKLSVETGQLKRQLRLQSSKTGGSPEKEQSIPKVGPLQKKLITTKNPATKANAKANTHKASAQG